MKILLFLICALLTAGLSLATDSPVAGTWDVAATPENGNKIAATLKVREEAGKLAGALVTSEGEEFALVEPKVEGSSFSFKLMVNGDTYQVDLRIDGAKLAGKYSGPEGSGVFEATKK